MKKTFGTIFLAGGLFAPLLLLGQGTLYLSNLGQTSAGSVNVGSDFWRAANFRTGNNSSGYTLNSVQLLLSSQLGNSSDFSVSLYDYDVRYPRSSLATLAGSDPVGSGIFTYSSPSIVLSPATYYFVVLSSATPVAQGSYNWNLANAPSFDSSDGWAMGIFGNGLGYTTSPNGSNWGFSGFGVSSPQFAIIATVVPEPGSSAFVGLGLVGLRFWRCQQRQIKESLTGSGATQ